MTEEVFVQMNKEKWAKYKKLISSFKNMNTQTTLANYQDIVADYAFAQSQFPDARVTLFLNQLAGDYYRRVNNVRTFDKYTFIRFFYYDIPLDVYRNRKIILLSFIIFLLFTIAGCIAANQSIENVVNELGPDYVEMTLNNIQNGKPTDVYNSFDCHDSFIAIFLNNISIDFKTYAYGIVPILGPLYIMEENGIMLGEFQTLFFLYDVGIESMESIWIHGTLEIGGCIIACAAAMILGLGWIFPKTHSRKYALKQSGLSSIRIFVSMLPLTLIAAILESFVTRHTEFPSFLRWGIIFMSLIYLLFYYVYLPHKVSKYNEK